MSLELIARRLSVPARQLGEPGPDEAELRALLAASIRVPDHGRLTPFRLLTIRGDARAKLGAALAELHERKQPDAPPSAFAKDRQRYSFAPLIVVVVARLDAEHRKVPAQEQLLTAGCVAYNLLLGAQALGYGAQWLTGWAAYDRDAAALLGLAEGEQVVGFVHVGSVREPAQEHARVALDDVVSAWG